MVSLLPNAKQQFLDATGVPVVGGLVYFCIPGTNTPKMTWQDPAQTIPNSNPVQLDGGGYAMIWGSGYYRQMVQDSNGVQIWDAITVGLPTVEPLPDESVPPPIPPLSAIETTDFDIVPFTFTYFGDSTGGAIVGTLPTNPQLDSKYLLKDYTGAASPTNPIGLDGNGLLIDGAATVPNFIQVAYGFGSVQFNGSSWSVVG